MFEPDAKCVLWGMSPMLLIVGAIYHVASVAAPHWLANSTAHWGLWTYCLREPCPKDVDCHCVSVSDQLNEIEHSWYRAAQGVEIAATVFVLAAIVTGMMRINLGHRIWQTASGLSAIVAGIFGVAGVIVYANNYHTIPEQVLSWAFMFNAASSSMCLLAGPLLILDAVLHRV